MDEGLTYVHTNLGHGAMSHSSQSALVISLLSSNREGLTGRAYSPDLGDLSNAADGLLVAGASGVDAKLVALFALAASLSIVAVPVSFKIVNDLGLFGIGVFETEESVKQSKCLIFVNSLDERMCSKGGLGSRFGGVIFDRNGLSRRGSTFCTCCSLGSGSGCFGGSHLGLSIGLGSGSGYFGGSHLLGRGFLNLSNGLSGRFFDLGHLFLRISSSFSSFYLGDVGSFLGSRDLFVQSSELQGVSSSDLLVSGGLLSESSSVSSLQLILSSDLGLQGLDDSSGLLFLVSALLFGLDILLLALGSSLIKLLD